MTYLRFHSIHDLVEGEPGCVQQHGIVSGGHGCQVAASIPVIALLMSRSSVSRSTNSPRAAISRCRRPGRSAGSATRKNLQIAWGNTTVPWSRPSQTRLRPSPACCCHSASRRLTTGWTATMLEAFDTSAVRISPVMSSPLSSTRPGGISRRSVARSPSSCAASFRSMPARKPARPTARNIAPVSRNSNPSRWARRREAVLLPAPAGPSMVMIMTDPKTSDERLTRNRCTGCRSSGENLLRRAWVSAAD